ncbi:glycosyltransferase [Haloferax elongans ATCC BAA-1513]|uniref:Glycosyltransferase n=2 Tax=Haloferax elongans TaxID=403191 RepID=M0HF56_HALEO|nr:glycosyltransferase [Haloferax elongans ATCC BAA-1513]
MGRRWVVDIFDLWLDNAADLGYVDEDSLQYRFVNMLEYSSMHISDKIFVITETMCEFYLEKYPEVHEEKIEIIPFGVNTELFSPDTNTTNNGSDIIYTGNLGTGQAFIPFLEAFAELDLNLTLSIVGDGERREELEKLVESLDIEDRVTFVGLVPREEIPERLSSAKVSLVPLKTEHSLDYARPNKMLEAMAVGTSYIASSVKEITKISEQRNTGVATCNERLTIKDAMETLIQNPELREEMGENGIKVINEEHDWEVIGQRATNSISKLVRE